MVEVRSDRFGSFQVAETDLIHIPNGILGFPGLHRYCLVDPGLDTLILWLQSTENPLIAFPVLEPQVFTSHYRVTLSPIELRELNLESVQEASVFNILTIPEDVAQMTANLKAPIVIHRRAQVARQIVLQESEYAIQFPVFKQLRTHLLTIESNRLTESAVPTAGIVPIGELPGSPVIHF